MKKVLFASAVTFMVITGFSSCTKCQNCTKANSPEVRLCENDYDSNTAYGAAVDGYETLGYQCK